MLGLELFLAAPQARPAARAVRELGRQLITARASPELLVLLGVDVTGLGKDPGHLIVDRLIGPGLAERRVGGDLRAVQRDQPDSHQAGLGAQLEHIGEQARERLLVTHAKTRDRCVVRRLVRADHTESNILHAAALDHPRRALTDRVRVEQQRDHHLRVKRSAPPPISAIRAEDPAQIDLLDRVEHTPRQVILAEPVTQAGRQQQLLITITSEEVLRHHRPPKLGDTTIVLNPPDDKNPQPTRFARQPQMRGFL
jgi:hypothetical protein